LCIICLFQFGLPKPFDQLGLPSTSTPKSQLGQTLGQSSHDMDESMKDDLITILTKIRDEYKELILTRAVESVRQTFDFSLSDFNSFINR
ncbi:unnamed protein product, partial [Timema podura]|nr:unnamed protein product [Timema podura]